MCSHDRTTQGPLMLSQAEIEQFHKEGWIGPYQLCSPEEMAKLRDQLQPILDDPKGPPWANLTMDAHMVSEPVFKIGSHPAAVERIADILGNDVLLWRAWTFTKPPGAPATGVHRDGRIDQTWPTVPGPVKPVPVLAIWVALDEATPESGCLWAFPRTWYVHWDREREPRTPPVDLAMYPTRTFLEEYKQEYLQLGRWRVSRTQWGMLVGLLRALGWAQRIGRAFVSLFSATKPNTFRAPPLSGLTRAEQEMITPYVGPNVNLCSVENVKRIPMEKVPMVCKPGEFYIFREDLIHVAPGNTTPNRRGAITFGYASPVMTMQEDRFPVLVHGTQPGPNNVVTPSFDGSQMQAMARPKRGLMGY